MVNETENDCKFLSKKDRDAGFLLHEEPFVYSVIHRCHGKLPYFLTHKFLWIVPWSFIISSPQYNHTIKLEEFFQIEWKECTLYSDLINLNK
ncbi:hypothetical protein A3Q56_04289 [Intoshia linei]|uniref:Uncharacterized protein n=1 Tax=Intoshia linei TaxID=1819745 RepID=A0A177B144_9BILA|nr:hypothetical protein A3Q56_04289 [Intoshia linei]